MAGAALENHSTSGMCFPIALLDYPQHQLYLYKGINVARLASSSHESGLIMSWGYWERKGERKGQECFPCGRMLDVSILTPVWPLSVCRVLPPSNALSALCLSVCLCVLIPSAKEGYLRCHEQAL